MKQSSLLIVLIGLIFGAALICSQANVAGTNDTVYYVEPQDALFACFNQKTGYSAYSVIDKEQLDGEELLFVKAVENTSAMDTSTGSNTTVFTAAVLYHNADGYSAAKIIPDCRLDDKPAVKLEGNFIFENKRIRYSVGRVNDLSGGYEQEFQKIMKMYDDHVFLSYQVDDLPK